MSLEIKHLQHLCMQAREFFGEQTIISGGDPRDILSETDVKDIDIFTRIEDDEEAYKKFRKSCERFALSLGGKAEIRECEPGYTDHFDLCDITAPHYKQKIEIIAVYVDPIDDVHNYDFSISQVFVTPNGLFQTEKAANDRLFKRITYFHDVGRSTDAHYRSKARLERLRAKYDGWFFFGIEPLDAMAILEEPDEVTKAEIEPIQIDVPKQVPSKFASPFYGEDRTCGL